MISDKQILAVYIYNELSSSRGCLGFFKSPPLNSKSRTLGSQVSENLESIGLTSLSG